MKRVIIPTINNFGPIQTKEGEYIEEKVRRITENGEPIEDGAPIIYTERKDGVNPAYNIRTDRWEIAQNAMEQVGNSKSKIIAMKIAKKDNTGEITEKNTGKVIEQHKNTLLMKIKEDSIMYMQSQIEINKLNYRDWETSKT